MARQTISKVVKQQVGDYVDHLRTHGLPITHAYIFGSYARGRARPQSDIDLCIISPAFRRMRDPLMFLWQQRKDRHLPIEPIGYTPQEFASVGDPLIDEVKRTGIRFR